MSQQPSQICLKNKILELKLKFIGQSIDARINLQTKVAYIEGHVFSMKCQHILNFSHGISSLLQRRLI